MLTSSALRLSAVLLIILVFLVVHWHGKDNIRGEYAKRFRAFSVLFSVGERLRRFYENMSIKMMGGRFSC